MKARGNLREICITVAIRARCLLLRRLLASWIFNITLSVRDAALLFFLSDSSLRNDNVMIIIYATIFIIDIHVCTSV